MTIQAPDVTTAVDPAGDLDLPPLTDGEAELLCHISRWGSDGYPIERVGRSWHWRTWRTVRGSPIVYKTKRAATEAFEAWHDLALRRWAAFKRIHPTAILTGQGVRI